VVGFFKGMPGQVSESSHSMWPVAKEGFINFYNSVKDWANSTIDDIVSIFKSLPSKIISGIKSGLSSASSALSSAGDTIASGFKHAIGIPGFASGVNNFSGGLALVGEQGPELVSLPN